MPSLSPDSFNDYHGTLQTAALNATRRAAVLPGDIPFHRSMDQDLAAELDAFSSRVLNMSNRILSLVANIDKSKGKTKDVPRLEGRDDVVDRFESIVVDSMDNLLENADACLDEFLGRKKAPAIAVNPPAVSPAKKVQRPNKTEPVVQHAANLSKPQLAFPNKPDNSDTPWYPSLTHKYNARVPLGYIYNSEGGAEDTPTVVANHPYHYEIDNLAYPSRMFTPATPIEPTSLDETEVIWVSTPEEFEKLLEALRSATEIAVDLEHHSYRSYRGFLCLMQISDRKNDYIIDLLALRNEIESLNEVFTNPEIVKVFHGAESDVVWLQQDFNVYIINLFDTFHASRLLEFPRHGLANLLEMYCDFVPDKRYQRADWRIRPLPADMLLYARSDTHFLLFIYDNLRNALLDRSKSRSQSKSRPPSPPGGIRPSSNIDPSTALLREALARSAETSLRVYTKEVYDAIEGTGVGGWDTIAKKWNKPTFMSGGSGVGIGAMQREVYKAVHNWRENVARTEDESTNYVLQTHFLFQLAEQPPADMPALLNVFRSSVPPVVRTRLKELLTTIREAVERGMKLVSPAKDVVIPSSGASRGSSVDAVAPLKNVTTLDVEMRELGRSGDSDEKTVQVAAVETTVNIWAQKPSSSANKATASPVASLKSSLFNMSVSKNIKVSGNSLPSPVRSQHSMLFGQVATENRTSVRSQLVQVASSSVKLSTIHAHQPAFRNVVAKINQGLVMSPSIPHITPIPASSATEVVTTTVKDPEPKREASQTPGEEERDTEIEVPFIPAAQRAIKRETEQDTIVMVGQSRPKRKREKGAGRNNANAEPSAGQETFDFSTVPNILDDNPNPDGDQADGETGRKKKKQKKEKPGKRQTNFYGDFPAPPKAHNEVKKGNQSATFK